MHFSKSMFLRTWRCGGLEYGTGSLPHFIYLGLWLYVLLPEVTLRLLMDLYNISYEEVCVFLSFLITDSLC